ALVQPMPRLTSPGRRLPRDRRTSESLPGAVDRPDRRPEGPVPDPAALHEGGRAPVEGAHRGWEVPGGRRPALPDGRRRRGDPVRGAGAQGRERRPDDPGRLGLVADLGADAVDRAVAVQAHEGGDDARVEGLSRLRFARRAPPLGSKCWPVSDAVAGSAGSGLEASLYGRFEVSASYTSATATIRAASEMSS